MRARRGWRARGLPAVACLALASALRIAVAAESATLKDLERIAIADTMVMMPMRDGARLATDIYRPREVKGRVPVIFIRTPYNFNTLAASTLQQVYASVLHGYAVVIQNERGRFYSEGEWEILGRPRTDGYDALTWLAKQPWSNGNVGTFGCSSSAEWQMSLAAMAHPAHKAMVAMSFGAGIGRMGEFYEQGSWYKGGVEQTLFAVWMYEVQQGHRPAFPVGLAQEQMRTLRRLYDLAPRMPQVNWKSQFRKLPAIDWVREAGGNEGPMRSMLQRTPDDPEWYRGGLYHDDQPFSVPAFWFVSWFDVSQGPNLALFNHARRTGTTREVRDGQYLVIAPTQHCQFFEIPEHEDLIVGELNVGRADHPMRGQIFAFFDRYLKGRKAAFPAGTARVQYYTMGRNQWRASDAWPPTQARSTTLYLASRGRANSLFGDGKLREQPSSSPSADTYLYDPMNPVPALGGGVCCNDGAAPGGSFDQRGIEARADVLVYSSGALAEPLEMTGSIHATLFVSSDALDTDFTVKLVDVYPDGTAYNVDDTILRARYREGYGKPVFMNRGEVYELRFTAMSTSYVFGAGHVIRVEVSSSKFPQYLRNLNTGGNNYDETRGVVATNSVHHSAMYPSRIEFPVVSSQLRFESE